MKALILAAGLGTRLRPHSQKLPKPLFPIGGKPLLDRHLAQLAQAGVTEVAVNTHHLHEQIESYLSRGRWDLEIHVSHEPEIMGTGGAMKLLADFWGKEPFLVINADVVSNLDLAVLYSAHLSSESLASLVMHDHPKYNSVAVDAAGRIVMMPPRSRVQRPENSRLMAFTGIHVIDPEVLGLIPEDQPYSIIDAYQSVIDRGQRLNAHLPETLYWRDIGTPDQYRQTAYEQLAPEAFNRAFDSPTPSDVAVNRTPLAGDGSDRRWYRLEKGTDRLILADHGLRDQDPPAEADAFVAIGRHLDRRDVMVPRIHLADPFSGLVFCQDLGDENLQARVAAISGADRTIRVEALYRQVIDALLNLGIGGVEGFDTAWTYQTASYDRDLILEKECRYFLEAFINGYLRLEIGYGELAADFKELATALMEDSVPGLVHRDMQARNIMVHAKRCYFIDFQGARPGPLQYDLASLLIDPYVTLSQEIQERLFDAFSRQVCEKLACDPELLERGYRLCRITRNLQILGAFAHLSQVKGKPGFEAHIPAATAGLVKNLNQPGIPACLCLKSLAARAHAAVTQEKE